MTRDLLFVSYFYPPCTDTGAHRPAAMAKYLRRLGHSVTVLTTRAYGERSDDPPSAVVRTADLQLVRARLRGHERVEAMFDSDTYSGRPHPLSKLLVPEPLVLAWTPFAWARARRLAREREFDCVITTSPPESAHLVGRALQRGGIPWVADVRDGWTFEPIRPDFPTAAQRRLDERLERRLLDAADAVVCVHEPVAEDLRRRAIADPIVVRNGLDPDLAHEAEDPADPGLASLLDPERVSLVYTGRFGSYGRDPEPFLRALERLGREHPKVAAKLELVIAGPLTERERELFAATDASPATIRLAGSLPRPKALALQRLADALLLIATPARSQLLNLKLFEYLAAGRPILALAEGTEAGRLVAELAAGVTTRADDPEAIVGALGRLVRAELPTVEPARLEPHSYPAPAEQMLAAVEQAIAAADRR